MSTMPLIVRNGVSDAPGMQHDQSGVVVDHRPIDGAREPNQLRRLEMLQVLEHEEQLGHHGTVRSGEYAFAFLAMPFAPSAYEPRVVGKLWFWAVWRFITRLSLETATLPPWGNVPAMGRQLEPPFDSLGAEPAGALLRSESLPAISPRDAGQLNCRFEDQRRTGRLFSLLRLLSALSHVAKEGNHHVAVGQAVRLQLRFDACKFEKRSGVIS